MFGADALKNALTLTIEDKSRNQRVACQEIRVKDGRYNFLTFRSIGEVFPLTTEGHIDVMHWCQLNSQNILLMYVSHTQEQAYPSP